MKGIIWHTINPSIPKLALVNPLLPRRRIILWQIPRLPAIHMLKRGSLDTSKNLRGTSPSQILATGPTSGNWHQNLVKLAVKTPCCNALVSSCDLQPMHKGQPPLPGKVVAVSAT